MKTGTIEKMIAVYLVVVLVGCVGYVMNIAKLCKCDFKPPYKAEAIRAAGVAFPPVGMFTGFIDIEDGAKCARQ